MFIYYGTTMCDEMISNNWKRLHGIPLKAKPRTFAGHRVMLFPFPLYECKPKRSVRKKKKYRFRHTFNMYKVDELKDTPDLLRIYNRYGYTRKKMKKKLRRLQRRKGNNVVAANI